MSNVVTFPDTVYHVITYLTAELPIFTDDAEVVHTIPDIRPARMVKVIRTGGPRLDLIREQAQITVECWDARVDNARDLAEVCRGLIYAMPDRYTDITTYRVQELSGVADLPDPDSASPRFTFTSLIDVRGNTL